MELDREQILSEIDTKIKYAKFVNTDAVILSSKAAQFCLEHAQFYEQKINELTIELNSMRTAANSYKMHYEKLEAENERLQSVEFTCGFVKPHKVLECPIFEEIERTKAETVLKMQSEIEKRCIEGGIYPAFVKSTIDQIAKEMLTDES